MSEKHFFRRLIEFTIINISLFSILTLNIRYFKHN